MTVLEWGVVVCEVFPVDIIEACTCSRATVRVSRALDLLSGQLVDEGARE